MRGIAPVGSGQVAGLLRLIADAGYYQALARAELLGPINAYHWSDE